MRRALNPVVAVLFGLLLAAVAARAAGAAEATCSVQYVSAQHVYLDAGAEAGLAPGMQVQVVRDGRVVASLEVVYTARTSASCRVIEGGAQVSPGDTVVYEAEVEPGAESGSEPAAPPVRTRSAPAPRSRPVTARGGARTSGSIALQWDRADETDGGDLSSTVWRVPFRLRISDLPGGWQMRTSGSLRRIERDGYPDYLEDGEWRNRVREVALVREGRRQAVHVALGRIRTRATSLTGPIDGVSIDRRWTDGLRLGLFAGFVPDWENLGLSTDSRLLGVGAHYQRGLATGRRFDLYAAGVGRYHRDGVSREWLGWTATWSSGRRWRLLQAAEIDLERGWREREDGQGLRLTSVALTGRYRISEALQAELGYDDREPVRVWETRALPDSLFTDAGRTQWRGRLSGRGLRDLRWSLGGGVRSPEDESGRTWSWNGRMTWPMPGASMRLRLAARGFDGPRLSGWSPSAGVERDFAGRSRAGLRFGTYRYADTSGLPDRSSNWLELSADSRFARDWTVRAEWRQDWSDEISGRRLLLELRRSF